MIITRTPLRISFVGGGSDRPSYYMEEPGACVAAAIDKYVTVTTSDKYDGRIRVAYSVTEDVTELSELCHELARECLREMGVTSGIEVHSIADIPGGTGLGSSSAFTVGLLQALRPGASAAWTAHAASRIEIERCKKPIGKQDQYAAAYGGVNLLRFTPMNVVVTPITCNTNALSSHCLLLDTGYIRNGDAGAVLSRQSQDRDDVRELAALAFVFADALADGEFDVCGSVMHGAWQIKKQFVGERYDQMYRVGAQAGAWGGKLCGAGGGGFMLFLAPPERHTAIQQALGLRHVPIRVGVPGSEVLWPAR